MKKLLGELRSVGASDRTINFVLVILVVFLFVLGAGCIGIILVQILRNETPAPSIVAIVTAIAVSAGGLITVSHTTNQINGTAAQSAQQAQNASNQSNEATAEIIQQVIAATYAAQKQADSHAEQVRIGGVSTEKKLEENTIATKENTDATDKATVFIDSKKEELS